jgi:hypothetical protein
VITYKSNLIQSRLAALYSLGQSTGDAAAQFAIQALKTLSWAHGGALVGMLTFLGHNQTMVASKVWLWIGFVTFAAGLGLALLAHLPAFLSQQSYHAKCWAAAEKIFFHSYGEPQEHLDTEESTSLRRGTNLQALGVGAALLSAFCFVLGCGFSLFALLG